MNSLMKQILQACAVVASLALGVHADDSGDSERGLGSVHKSINRSHNAAPTIGGTGVVTPAIIYHGGPLIGTPNIYVIWYGNWNANNGSDTPAGQEIVRDFLRNIGGSPYLNINQSYGTTTYPITGNASFGGETTDTGSAGLTLRDSSMLTIINTALKNGKLPPDPNGIYLVLTSSANVKKSGFCTSYCGWHTSGTSSQGMKVRYSFVGNANKCLNACAAQTISPNGNAGVDGMLSVIAHEVEETIADPDPSSGWVDSAGAENADKCAWTFGTTQVSNGAYYNMTLGSQSPGHVSRNYLIQRNLKHADAGDTCVMQ